MKLFSLMYLGTALTCVALTPVAANAAGESPELGYQAIQDGKWNEAETQLRAGLAKSPNDPKYLLNLAYVLQKSGRQEEAVSVYEQVLQLDRDPLVAVGPDSDVRPKRAKLLAKKGMAALPSDK